MLTFFRPKAGRRGAHPAFVPAFLGSPTLTANNTTTLNCGGPHRKSFLTQIAQSVRVVPADSDGTILAVFYKWDASADAAVALTGNVDLEALTADETAKVTLLSTLTDAQKTFDEGDTIRIVVTNNSAAINTQPTGWHVCPEFLVLE